MRSYARPEDALADVLELCSAMTRKFAVCDVPRGGGKAVLAVPELPTGDARTKLLHRYGDFITSLGGLYSCAPDMNTSERDMDIIAETCPYVFCKTVENGGSGSTAPATAKGVFHGIEASVQHALGSDLRGVRVLVQGMGSVGGLLAGPPGRGGRGRVRLRRRRRPGSPSALRSRRTRSSASSATCSRRAPPAA